MKFEPASAASEGVIIRFCSSDDAPAGRIPGVTSATPSGTMPRSRPISSGEHTSPPTPLETASFASSSTCHSGSSSTPVSARESASNEVRTVTPKIARSGLERPAALTAASIISRPPLAWTVSMETGSAATLSTAEATVLGMSNNFRSRKILNPIAAVSRTSSAPYLRYICRPIFTHSSLPRSPRKISRACSLSGRSRASINLQSRFDIS